MITRNRILTAAIVVSAFALGMLAQSTAPIRAFSTKSTGASRFTIKSGNDVVAEVHLLVPAKFKADSSDEVAVQSQRLGVRTGAGGNVVIEPSGLSPWRISGPGIELQFEEKSDGK